MRNLNQNDFNDPIRRRKPQTARNAAIGASFGAVLGALVAGPLGAMIGGALGGGTGGYLGAEADKENENR